MGRSVARRCGITKGSASGWGFAIGEAIEVWVVDREPIQHVRRVMRRQQTDLGTAERCCEADGEAIAVAAKIDHVAPPRQQRSEHGDVAQEGFHRDRAIDTLGEQ